MHVHVTWPRGVQPMQHKMQYVWMTKHPHWTDVHINELQLKAKCHKLHKLEKKNEAVTRAESSFNLARFYCQKRNCAVIWLNWTQIGFKYNNLVNQCWIIMLGMAMMCTQHKLVIRHEPCKKTNPPCQQQVAEPPTSLKYCLFYGRSGMCMLWWCELVNPEIEEGSRWWLAMHWCLFGAKTTATIMMTFAGQCISQI